MVAIMTIPSSSPHLLHHLLVPRVLDAPRCSHHLPPVASVAPRSSVSTSARSSPRLRGATRLVRLLYEAASPTKPEEGVGVDHTGTEITKTEKELDDDRTSAEPTTSTQTLTPTPTPKVSVSVTYRNKKERKRQQVPLHLPLPLPLPSS